MTHVKCVLNTDFDPSKRLSSHFLPFFSLQLYENCRMLHEYTRAQRKKAAQGEGPGFDGELNDFQAPQLSSLARLVRIFVLLILFASC
jgi:hypothetical protein